MHRYTIFRTYFVIVIIPGAKIQTVSGIRGQIKKAQGKDGVFRATFEDKILMSDLIVCKAWIKVGISIGLPIFTSM